MIKSSSFYSALVGALVGGAFLMGATFITSHYARKDLIAQNRLFIEKEEVNAKNEILKSVLSDIYRLWFRSQMVVSSFNVTASKHINVGHQGIVESKRALEEEVVSFAGQIQYRRAWLEINVSRDCSKVYNECIRGILNYRNFVKYNEEWGDELDKDYDEWISSTGKLLNSLTDQIYSELFGEQSQIDVGNFFEGLPDVK